MIASALSPVSFTITRHDLFRYAGASGDFNPIHWSQRAASAAGLPGVIAHGMLTMALAARALTLWTGNPGCVIDCQARFIRPVLVPDHDSGTTITITGTITGTVTGSVGTAPQNEGPVRVTLTATDPGGIVAELVAELVGTVSGTRRP